MKQSAVVLSLPAETAYLGVAEQCTRAVATLFGFDEPSIGKIELAVEEAVSNVIEHAYRAEAGKTFDLIFERVPLGLQVRIKEKGIPFDPRLVASYDPAQIGSEETPTGLGLYLMNSVMDEVSFHNLGLEGKETHLVKYRSTPGVETAEDLLPGADESAREPEVITERIDYEVRLLQPSEAIEVSRCAYKSHGYTFFDEHIYFPDRLIELNRSGQMISAVAVTKDGTFMGHAALVYPKLGAEIAELTFVFVNLEYRGQGCMNRLCDYLFNQVEHHLHGIYAYAVTNHVFTQKVMLKYGFGDCCIELATSPATWEFKGMEKSTQRLSVVTSFKYLVAPERLTIYAPPQHREMIEAIYRNLGVTHDYVAPAQPALLPAEASQIDIELDTTENFAEIHLIRAGEHAVHEVHAALRSLCVKQVAAIYLFLDMTDPATHHLTGEMEQLGFFFAGILPHCAVNEGLVLQYLNNQPLDYSKIQTYSDLAKRLLEKVRHHDPNRDFDQASL